MIKQNNFYLQTITFLVAIFWGSLLFGQTQLGGDIDGEAANDYSGNSVSLDNNRMAIAANYNDGNGNNSGHVRVYEWNGTAWVQLGIDIDGEAADDRSGESVSLDGNRVAIGAHKNDGNGNSSGHVRIYEWNGTAWVQLGTDINGEASNDESGKSVSLDGNRVAIGAHKNDGNGNASGHVRIYEWNGSAWMQLGGDINGEFADDYSGEAVSLDGDRVAIGAGDNPGGGTDRGHVRIYEWNGSAWMQLGGDINGSGTSDYSGRAVSLDGNRVAIGAPVNNGGPGYTRIYEWNGTYWNRLGADIDGEANGDDSGESVSLDGNIVAIGASRNDSTGHARIYEWNGTAWTQIGIDIDGENTVDRSGDAVSLSGNRVAIGAARNAGNNGSYSGHVRVYDFSLLTATQQIALEERLSIRIYPNPTPGQLQIDKQANENLQLHITDIKGQVLYTKNWENDSEVINLESLPTGTYFLSVSNGKENITQKIVKQ